MDCEKPLLFCGIPPLILLRGRKRLFRAKRKDVEAKLGKTREESWTFKKPSKEINLILPILPSR